MISAEDEQLLAEAYRKAAVSALYPHGFTITSDSVSRRFGPKELQRVFGSRDASGASAPEWKALLEYAIAKAESESGSPPA